MTNDIERHSPDEWRKTAAALMSESVAVGAGETTAKVNANGAPLLGDSRDLFRPKTSDIPAKPGVYKWRDGEGRVIYVGKAKNLRNRLTNYFQPLYLLHPRTQTMVLTARSLEWTVVATELESLTLEYTWIKEFDPRFNVQFRDDKTYPYLAVSTGERIPRVWVTRSRKRRDTRYFGPYAKVWELRHSLDRLLRTFPVRTCTTNVFHKAQLTGRPCLFASIGKCSAPCVNRIEADEHRRLCEQLVGVMTGRLGRPYIAQLTRDMKEASAELEFEKAARLRDQIQMLETVVQQNAVVFDQDVDADVFGFASDELEASVHAFYVRAGSIRGERNWSVERVEDIDDADLMADLLVQVYSDAAGDNHPQSAATISTNREAIGSTQTITATDAVARAQATRERNTRQETTGRADLLAPIAPVPREIIVPVEPARREELEGWLTNLRGGAVTIRVASRGDKKQLMDRANENASQALQRSKMSRISDMGARTQAMNDVAKALGLAEAPLRIECYDISNTVGGAFQVASMVVFTGGKPDKNQYRRFKIKTPLDEANDFLSMQEVMRRRYAPERLNDERFGSKPDLIILDGGKPQLTAALAMFEEMGIDDIAICGLAKRDEELFVPWQDTGPVVLPSGSASLYLVKQVRDEAHRFAITFHRELRGKGMTASILDDVAGLGPVRKKALMKHFKSFKNLKAASLEDIKAAKVIPEEVAEELVRVLAQYNERKEEKEEQLADSVLANTIP